MCKSILTWLTGIKQEKCSGNAYISYHDDDGDECVIADLNDVRTALELGNKKFEIKVNASAARAAEHAGAAAAAATNLETRVQELERDFKVLQGKKYVRSTAAVTTPAEFYDEVTKYNHKKWAIKVQGAVNLVPSKKAVSSSEDHSKEKTVMSTDPVPTLTATLNPNLP